jgi:hypothetical protein
VVGYPGRNHDQDRQPHHRHQQPEDAIAHCRTPRLRCGWPCPGDEAGAIMGAWNLSWRGLPQMETRTLRRHSSWPEMVQPSICWLPG